MFNRRIGLFLLAIAGLLVSSYLLIQYTSDTPIACGTGHGCETVRLSAYAQLFGLPTPLYGVVFYLWLAALAIAVDINLVYSRWRKWVLWELRAATLIGLGVSAWLTYVEAFVIHAWCWWCVVSAIVATLAFVVVWYKRWD